MDRPPNKFNRMQTQLLKRQSSDFWIYLGIIAFSVIIRIAFIATHASELETDTDSYLGIARKLAERKGFASPYSDSPTAFRPPLYPILIAPISSPSLAWARGGLNVLAAGGSLFLIWGIAQSLRFSRTGIGLALFIFGLDPLLIRYSSMTMTETTAAFFSALLLWRLTVQKQDMAHTPVPTSSILTGIVFGLCVLTRPSFWAFGILLILVAGLKLATQSLDVRRQIIRHALFTGLGVILVVSPWVIRNTISLGSPIMMTTHGGYTILLGNNQAFYDEVVSQPIGTIWDGSHGGGQAVWADGINKQMDKLELFSEVDRDRWQAQLARNTVAQNPGLFAKACLLRFLRFWNVTPSGPAAEGNSPTIIRIVGGYYAAVWCLLMGGLFQLVRQVLRRDDQICINQWVPVFLVIASFTTVHLIYWSNVRMRAPIVPAIAILAGYCCLQQTRDASTTSDD